jgi:hypothetical protein
MGDFRLTTGREGFRFRLLDEEDQLERPDVLGNLRWMRQQLNRPPMLNRWLQPPWESAEDNLQRILRAGAPDAAPPAIPRTEPGAGPDTPREGSTSDLVNAVWRLEVVQRQVRSLHGETRRQMHVLEREWESSSHAERAIMLTMGGLVAASMITPLLAHDQSRAFVLGLLHDVRLPVPGVDGMSFRLRRQGARVDFNMAPGLRGMGQVDRSDRPGETVDYRFMITLDVMELLRANNIHF